MDFGDDDLGRLAARARLGLNNGLVAELRELTDDLFEASHGSQPPLKAVKESAPAPSPARGPSYCPGLAGVGRKASFSGRGGRPQLPAGGKFLWQKVPPAGPFNGPWQGEGRQAGPACPQNPLA